MYILNAFNLNTNQEQKEFVKTFLTDNEYEMLHNGYADLIDLLDSDYIDLLAELR